MFVERQFQRLIHVGFSLRLRKGNFNICYLYATLLKGDFFFLPVCGELKLNK